MQVLENVEEVNTAAVAAIAASTAAAAKAGSIDLFMHEQHLLTSHTAAGRLPCPS